MKLRSMISLMCLGLSAAAVAAPLDDQKKYETWLADFKKADVNYSGGLSKAELDKTAPRQFMTIKRRFADMDANRDSQVTPYEYGRFVDMQRKKWEAAFNQVDLNHSGGLSKLELDKTPARQFAGIKKSFDAMDVNRDGQVTMAERDGYTPAPKAAPQDWQAAFKKADVNDSGGLSQVELSHVAPGTLEDLKKGFAQVDTNRDGHVTMAEYQASQASQTADEEDDEEDNSVMSFLKNLLGGK